MTAVGFRVILVRPLYAGNVGAVARAMANCGFRQLVVVGSRWGPWPEETHRMASGADFILEEAHRADTVGEALAGCTLAAGTTTRERADGVPLLTPGEVAFRLVEASRTGEAALLFGPEDHGLSAEELGLCSLRIRIPASELHRSLNLAQAVMVVCHRLFLETHAPAAGPAGQTPAEEKSATLEQLEQLFADWSALLTRVEFLNPQNPAHIMGSIRRILLRARMSPREVRIFRGIARQVRWALSSQCHSPLDTARR